MNNPQRPEVDDPRVLALAKARQERANKNPFNAGFCPPWEGLSGQEQRLSLLDARNYLHAALDAGLVPAGPVAVPPTTSTADRAAIAEDLRYLLNYRGPGHGHEWPGVWDTSGMPCGHCARLAVAQRNLAAYDAAPDASLPAGSGDTATTRAAALAEAATLLDQRATGIDAFASSDHGEEARAVRELAEAANELRRLAAETQPDTQAEAPCCSDPTCTCNQVNAKGRCACTKWESSSTPAAFEADPASKTSTKADSKAEIVHGCPPDGSGLTPCCGRTPFELPLTDRISSEAPVTCRGAL